MDPKLRFHAHFHDSVSLINDQIASLQSLASVPSERQEAIDHILASVAKLQNEVADAAEFTPSYDRRQYADTVRSLQDALNTTIAKVTPKSRFQFKRPASKPSTTTHVDMGSAMNDPRLHPSSDPPAPLASSSSASPPPRAADTSSSSAKDPSTLHLTSLSARHVPVAASPTPSSASLTCLQRCIVDLSAPTLTAPLLGLAMRDISSSVVVAGRVSGPVHITAVSSSVLVISARQVRIHECRDVDIYLHCSSHPIIEDCSGMRFAPLPATYATANSEDPEQNQWDQVDDFKWLKAGPSPNWTTLSEAERLPDETWSALLPKTELPSPVGVEETLRKFNISTRRKRNSSSAGSNP